MRAPSGSWLNQLDRIGHRTEPLQKKGEDMGHLPHLNNIEHKPSIIAYISFEFSLIKMYICYSKIYITHLLTLVLSTKNSHYAIFNSLFACSTSLSFWHSTNSFLKFWGIFKNYINIIAISVLMHVILLSIGLLTFTWTQKEEVFVTKFI